METLSDKRQFNGRYVEEDIEEYIYDEEDVKEFIKKLKDIIYKTDSDDICGSCQACVSHIIDKLAGPKLI